jgi:hypothetical protein
MPQASRPSTAAASLQTFVPAPSSPRSCGSLLGPWRASAVERRRPLRNANFVWIRASGWLRRASNDPDKPFGFRITQRLDFLIVPLLQQLLHGGQRLVGGIRISAPDARAKEQSTATLKGLCKTSALLTPG